jgi:hypothetical protein
MILEFIQSDLSPFTKYNRMSKGTETNNEEKQKRRKPQWQISCRAM